MPVALIPCSQHLYQLTAPIPHSRHPCQPQHPGTVVSPHPVPAVTPGHSTMAPNGHLGPVTAVTSPWGWVTASAPHSANKAPAQRVPLGWVPPSGSPGGRHPLVGGCHELGWPQRPRPLEQRARDSGWAGAAAGGDAGTRWGEQRSPGHRDKGTIKLTQPRCPTAGIFHLGPRGNRGVRVAPTPTGDPGGTWGSQGCQPWRGRG